MIVNLCESVCDRKPFENEVQVRKFMVLRDEFVVDRLEGLMAALELTRISCKSETHSVEGPSQHVHLLGGESRFVDFDFTLAPGEPCRGFGKCAKRSDDGTRDPVGDEADDEYDREIEPGYAADRNDDRCERFLVVLFENQGPAEASQGDLGPHDAHVLDIVVMSDLQTGGPTVICRRFGSDEACARVESSGWIQEAHVAIEEEGVRRFAEVTRLKR